MQCYLVLRPADETLAVVLTGEDDVEGGGRDGSLLTEHLSRPPLELTWRQERGSASERESCGTSLPSFHQVMVAAGLEPTETQRMDWAFPATRLLSPPSPTILTSPGGKFSLSRTVLETGRVWLLF